MLVIIGLIVGGVLVGQDLIRAAEVRAQISQIEKYNTAVNTFYGKYDAIPGDMNPTTAGQFGFTVGTGCDGHSAGYRDGNGLIDGYFIGQNLFETIGETAFFWVDLSTAGLIEGKYPNGGAAPVSGCGTVSADLGVTPSPNYLGDYFPEGKIGHGNFVYVYEDNGANWYGLSALTSTSSANGAVLSNSNIPVGQAYRIDKKIDDEFDHLIWPNLIV